MEGSEERLVLEEKRFGTANDDQQNGAEDKEVGWESKNRGRFAHSTQIHHSNQHNQKYVYRDDRWSELWEKCHKRLYTSRNADRDGEDIVNHQGGSRDQARQRSQVLLCYNIRSSTIGIGWNGLAVGEGDNSEQSNDGKADKQRYPEVL